MKSNIRYSKRKGPLADNNGPRKCDVGGFHKPALSGIITSLLLLQIFYIF